MSLAAPVSTDTQNLAGAWFYRLDPRSHGETERWFLQPFRGESLPLPGSLQQHRIGDAITVDTPWTGGIFDRSYFTSPAYAPYRQPGHIKVPFWLQPETHYVGAAWYQREIDVPASWAGRRIVLTLERPHITTDVWIDDRWMGTNNSLCTPHVYELGLDLTPGLHRLTVRVNNTPNPDVGENAHSVSDHTQGNWNGLVGQLTLRATGAVWISELQLFPHPIHREVQVRGVVAVAPGQIRPSVVHLTSSANRPRVEAAVATDGTFTATYSFPSDAALWDEFTPVVHHLTVTLPQGEARTLPFGFRELVADGRQLRLNGRKLFLRGTLDCAAFPRTGFPPTDVHEWRRLFTIIQSHGLNHVRFHSWCPPEAAFAAADELGLYLQIEVASWPNWSTTLGDGLPLDAWMEEETERILRVYGHHPSFLILCACNEPSGAGHTTWLGAWIERWRRRDPRRLYTAGAGWPEIPENDLHIHSEPRIQHWEEGLRSRINARPPETRTDYRSFIAARAVPVISHEIGQWCVYPNFGEMPKYDGHLQPRNLEIFRESLTNHHLLAQAPEFLAASGRLQALCYKEEIEASLRTPEMGGFQLLGLSDFPGQGTALVGVLDAFWEQKGYISPDAFRRFCSETVVLARLDQRVFTTNETLTAEVEVAHFGPAPLQAASARWELRGEDGRAVAAGAWPACSIPVGAGTALGSVTVPLSDMPAPARYRLAVSLDAPSVANDWEIWVYPAASSEPPSSASPATLVREWDAATQARLDAGEAVVWSIAPERVAPDPEKGPIALGFSSIFWNTAWTNGQAPHTLGILCDPAHPALAHFPTDSHSNWQWWYPLQHAAPLLIDHLPSDVRPIVQVIDDWFTNRRLALVLEARVGRGRLLITSIDLAATSSDPVCRQLLASLLAHAASPAFRPSVELTPEQIVALLRA